MSKYKLILLKLDEPAVFPQNLATAEATGLQALKAHTVRYEQEFDDIDEAKLIRELNKPQRRKRTVAGKPNDK